MNLFHNCILYKIDPLTGEKTWYNFCPICNKPLDR